MKMVKILPVVAALLLAACTKPHDPILPDIDGNIPGTGGGSAAVPGSPVPPVSDWDGMLADDADNDTVGDNEDLYWELNDFSREIRVVFDGNTANVDGDESVVADISGAYVTLDFTGVKKVNLIVSGASDDGALKIYGDAKYKLTFDGLALVSQRGPAVNNQCKKRVFVHLSEGTVNTLADCAGYVDDAWYPEGKTADDEDRKGCFFSEGNIILSGTGALCVTGSEKHAVATDKYFVMRPGATLVVMNAAKNGLHVKGDDGTGIDIRGGLFHATVSSPAGKCMKTDDSVVISGGRLYMKTTGDAVYDADEKDTSSAACVKADGNITISGGYIQAESSGSGGKGINADGALTVEDGDIYISTSGGKYVYNASLDSSPKGIKAEGDITVDGGYVNISVTGRSDGSEGLESKALLTINGGEIVVNAYDDAVNAATGIVINGGKLYAYAENNDGIDSNGYLYLNGGLVVASGSAVPEEGIDCDRSENFHITGGTIIGTGGAAIAPSTSATTQRTIVYNSISPASKGSIIAISDGSGKTLMMYELPRTWQQGMSLLFSSPDIAQGATCTLWRDVSAQADSSAWYGWYGSASWSGGSQVGTFTTTDMVTTIGRSTAPGGGPGGGGPGGRPW